MMLANYTVAIILATAGKCMIIISCFLIFYCSGQSLLPFQIHNFLIIILIVSWMTKLTVFGSLVTL